MTLRGSGSSRLQSIDALRGAAALAVVLFHASKVNELTSPGAWIGSAPERVLAWGRFGVWLFFVISGFCIHLRWASQYDAVTPPRLDFLAFWKRRFVRLYPPYAIALALYVAVLFLEGMKPTSEVWWRIGLHLTLLNNLDPVAVDSINGVFWTLAIEEQLYLAYFVLLKLRVRFGWTVTLTCCLMARAGWFALALVLHRAFGTSLVVTQAAAAQWIVWALGALAVEAAFGIVRLPSLWRRGWFGSAILAVAIAVTSAYLTSPDGLVKNLLWFAGDLLWGAGFFVWINRAAELEQRWRAAAAVPRWVAPWAAIGLFSYSIYLIHELVVHHAWLAILPSPMATMTALLLIVVVLTVASVLVARLFFAWFERPFMTRARRTSVTLAPSPAI